MKLQNGAGGPDIFWPQDSFNEIMGLPNIYAVKEDSKSDPFLLDIQQATNNAHFIISGGGMRRWSYLMGVTM